MSGFVVMLDLEGGPVDGALLDRMTALLSRRGPDARAHVVAGPAGLGHALHRTTWESAFEHQPFAMHERYWIVSDARVDARDELARNLGISDMQEISRITDPELILRAYIKWGERCVEHLLGDFSFAIWDTVEHRLFCARDHFGVRMFYYTRIGTTLVASNTLDCIRLHPGVSDRLNEQALGDFLLFDCNWSLETTYYSDIQNLPPAHALTVRNGLLTLQKYWELKDPEVMRLPSDEDYIEGFREQLHRAVSDRIRTDKVSLSFSGGLDSTAVAAAGLASGRASGLDHGFKAFTIVYDKIIPDKERHYSKLAAERLGIPIEFIPSDDFQLLDFPADENFDTSEPMMDLFPSKSVLTARTMARHSAVALTGDGVDEFLKTNRYVDLARRGPFLGQTFDLLTTVLRHGYLPPIGTGLLKFLSRIRGKGSKPSSSFPSWIRSDTEQGRVLRDRWLLVESGYKDPLDPLGGTKVPRFHAPLWQRKFAWAEADRMRFRMETRSPMLDIRMISFGLAVPDLPWACNKYLLRRLGRGILPESVLSRPKQGLAGEPFFEKFRENRLDADFRSGEPLHPGMQNMVSASAWRITLQEPKLDAWPLWEALRVMALNEWLRKRSP